MKQIYYLSLVLLLISVSYSAQKEIGILPSSEYKNTSPLPCKESSNLKGKVKEVQVTDIKKCLSNVKVDVGYMRYTYDKNGFQVAVESKSHDTSQYVVDCKYVYEYDYRGYVTAYTAGKKRVLIEYTDDYLVKRLLIHKLNDSVAVLTDIIEYAYDKENEIIQKKCDFLSRNFSMDNHYKKIGNVTELCNFEGANNLSFKNYMTYNSDGDLINSQSILYDTIIGTDTTVFDTLNNAFDYSQYDLNKNWLEKRYITLRGRMKIDSVLHIVSREITYY